MPHLVIAIVLGVVLLLIWVIGLSLGVLWVLLAMASGVALLLAFIVEGVGLYLNFKQGKNPAAAGTSAARASIKALHQRWYAELPALRTVQGGGLALIDQPWYVVIGAQGVGKTRFLQESGLDSSRNRHGLRAANRPRPAPSTGGAPMTRHSSIPRDGC